jgi:UDP-3-O-[3-hydroxymyristoyl] N-acetylglucosamine deacetylase
LFLADKTSLSSSCIYRQKRKAQTLQKEVFAIGKGLFTGVEAKIALLPAPAGSGVVFQRMDLPGSPELRAHLDLVQGTPRCTIVGNSCFSVQTVEHLLAALAAYQIDNIRIQLTGPEVPIFDGSSLMFIQMLDKAGTVEQDEEKILYTLRHPISCAKNEALLIALPSDQWKISYTLHYPNDSCIGTQFYSTVVDRNLFEHNIAPCRTFSVYEEVAPLIEQGFLKGGSLENAIVIKNKQIVNPEGLRFPDEMVRHKILDMIGDLFLMGISFSAHIVAVRSGHCMNNLLARALVNHFKEGELCS